MSRGRRTLYVELNRPVAMEIYYPSADDDDDDDIIEFISDYFVLSVPEPNSEHDVWLIKTFNRTYEIQGWVELTAESVELMELDNTMNEYEIMLSIDHYQRDMLDELWQYDEMDDEMEYVDNEQSIDHE